MLSLGKRFVPLLKGSDPLNARGPTLLVRRLIG